MEPPNDSWDGIFKNMEGCQGHYKNIAQNNFRAKEGTEDTPR